MQAKPVRRRGNRFEIRVVESAEASAVTDLSSAEDLLARLVARAFAAEHPHPFGLGKTNTGGPRNAGPRLHRRAGRALTPREDGPAESESEHVDYTPTSQDAGGSL